MVDIIALLLLGLGFAYFATQNTATAVMHFGPYAWNSVPLYAIVLGSMLLGVTISAIISAINSVSTTFTLFRKDKRIQQTEASVESLQQRVNELEVENAQLKTVVEVDDPTLDKVPSSSRRIAGA